MVAERIYPVILVNCPIIRRKGDVLQETLLLSLFPFLSYVYTCGCVYMYSGKSTVLCVKSAVEYMEDRVSSMSVSSFLAVVLNNLKTWSSQISLTSQHYLELFMSHHSHWSCQAPQPATSRNIDVSAQLVIQVYSAMNGFLCKC